MSANYNHISSRIITNCCIYSGFKAETLLIVAVLAYPKPAGLCDGAAVLAVFTGNYQRATPVRRRNPQLSGYRRPKEQRGLRHPIKRFLICQQPTKKASRALCVAALA
jgi:hypothetical protein